MSLRQQKKAPLKRNRDETPVGEAIIHIDAFLECLRKRKAHDVQEMPKWLAKLTIVERKKLQRSYRQTFIDMKTAAKGKDNDLSFAYAHYKLDALRAACAFFSQFIYEQKTPPTSRKTGDGNKIDTFAGLFQD